MGHVNSFFFLKTHTNVLRHSYYNIVCSLAVCSRIGLVQLTNPVRPLRRIQLVLLCLVVFDLSSLETRSTTLRL